MRQNLARRGRSLASMDDDRLRAVYEKSMADFRDKAPLTADGAAAIILDGIRAGTWRILVGEDAKLIDRKVRESPETAYDKESSAFLGR